jgi:hypothetical protein
MESIQQHRLYQNHDFDTAFSTLYRVYKKNFLPLFLLSLAGTLIVYLFAFLLGPYQIPSEAIPDPGPGDIAHFVSLFLLILVVGLLVYTFVYLGIMYLVYRQQEDDPRHAWSIFAEAARKYYFRFLLLVILVSLIFIVGSVIGLLIFFVGIILALAYLGVSLYVAGPALIVENTGPGDAIWRSFSLSHKDFWMSLGLVLVLLVITMVIQFVLLAIVSLPGAVIFISGMVSGGDVSNWFASDFSSLWTGFGVIAMVLNSAVSALVMPLMPVFSMILYYRLRYTENKPGQQG